jgi:hypothetical protein
MLATSQHKHHTFQVNHEKAFSTIRTLLMRLAEYASPERMEVIMFVLDEVIAFHRGHQNTFIVQIGIKAGDETGEQTAMMVSLVSRLTHIPVALLGVGWNIDPIAAPEKDYVEDEFEHTARMFFTNDIGDATHSGPIKSFYTKIFAHFMQNKHSGWDYGRAILQMVQHSTFLFVEDCRRGWGLHQDPRNAFGMNFILQNYNQTRMDHVAPIHNERHFHVMQ